MLSEELEIYLYWYGRWAKWPESAIGMRSLEDRQEGGILKMKTKIN